MAEAAVIAAHPEPETLDPSASAAPMMKIQGSNPTESVLTGSPIADGDNAETNHDSKQPSNQASMEISTNTRSLSLKSQSRSESRSRSRSSHSLSRSRSATLSRSPSRSRSLSGSRSPSRSSRRGRNRGRARMDVSRSPRRNSNSPPRMRRSQYNRSRSDDEAYAEALRGANAPTFNVFVRTIPDHATEDDLHDAFKDFGEIFSTKIVIPAASRRRASAPSSGPTSSGAYGFVNFVTEEGQKNALDASRDSRIELAGIILECKISDGSTVISVTNIPSSATRSDFRYLIRKEVGPYNAVAFQGRQSFIVYNSFYEAERAIRKINSGGGLRLNGSALCAAVASEAKSRRGQTIRESPNERTIFVAKVPAEIGVEDLRSHFAVYGEITSVRLAGGNTSGRGYAFVEFANSGDSEIAFHEAQDSDLKGFRLQLDWCRDTSRGGSGGGGGSRRRRGPSNHARSDRHSSNNSDHHHSSSSSSRRGRHHRDGYDNDGYSGSYRRGRPSSRERDSGRRGGSNTRRGHSPSYAPPPPPYYMPPPFMYPPMMDPKMLQRMGLFGAGPPVQGPTAGNAGMSGGSDHRRDGSMERDRRNQGSNNNNNNNNAGDQRGNGMRPPHGMDFSRMMPYSAAYMAAAAAAHHPWISASAPGDHSPPHGNAMGRRPLSSYDRHPPRRSSNRRSNRSPTRSFSRSRSPRRRR